MRSGYLRNHVQSGPVRSVTHQTSLLWGGVGHCSLENKKPRSQSPRHPLDRSVTAPQASQKLRSKEYTGASSRSRWSLSKPLIEL